MFNLTLVLFSPR